MGKTMQTENVIMNYDNKPIAQPELNDINLMIRQAECVLLIDDSGLSPYSSSAWSDFCWGTHGDSDDRFELSVTIQKKKS